MLLDVKFEQKMRLKFNIQSGRIALNRLKEATENNNEQSIYSSIAELLLWVLNIHDWHLKHGCADYEKRALADEKGILLFGLRHAYNSMKHNMNFFVIHNKEVEFSYDSVDYSKFDYRPTRITWIKTIGMIEEGQSNQINNYKDHIEGKEVIQTFNDALTFLNQENKKVLF